MKLKAATLLESLLAMIVIVICLGIGTMIFVNVLGSDNERNRLKARSIFSREMSRIKSEKRFLDEEKKAGSWLLTTKISRYENTEDLYHIRLRLEDEGKVIEVYNELLLME